MLGKKSYYISVGGEISKGDNFSSLKPKTLSERSNYGTEPDDRYEISSKDVHYGSYKKGLMTTKYFADFYLFFKKNIVLHFDLESIDKDDESKLNIGFGVLFSFKDAKDKKNLVNTELYLKFNDFENKARSKDSKWKRSQFGLRFSIPINFGEI